MTEPCDDEVLALLCVQWTQQLLSLFQTELQDLTKKGRVQASIKKWPFFSLVGQFFENKCLHDKRNKHPGYKPCRRRLLTL